MKSLRKLGEAIASATRTHIESLTEDEVQRQVHLLVGREPSRVADLLTTLLTKSGTDNQATIRDAAPEVRLMVWLIVARKAHDTNFQEESLASQWGNETMSALAWWTTAAEFLGPMASSAATNMYAKITGSNDGPASFLVSKAAALAVSQVVFQLATYYDVYTHRDELGHKSSWGNAYRALFIDEDIGTMVDNAHEPDFVSHLTHVILDENAPTAGELPLPTEHDDDSEEAMAKWKARMSEWANKEFRAWIAVWFRVAVTPLSPGNAQLKAYEQPGDTWGPAHRKQGGFVDLTTWQARLKKV